MMPHATIHPSDWRAGGVVMAPSMAPMSCSVHPMGSPAPARAGRAASPDDGGGPRTALGKVESDGSVGTWTKPPTVAASRRARPEASKKRAAFDKAESGTWTSDLRTAASRAFGRLRMTDRSNDGAMARVLTAIMNGKPNDHRLKDLAAGEGMPCFIVQRDHPKKTHFQVCVSGARVLAQKVALACCKQKTSCRHFSPAAWCPWQSSVRPPPVPDLLGC